MNAFTPIFNQTPTTSSPMRSTDIRAILARLLDRAADHQLHLGYHQQAERLSRQAADLRETAQ